MEMHSPQSLYAVHGISIRTRTRSRSHWMRHLFALLLRLTTSFKAELRARRAAVELAGKDDRMLRDIGIERSEIESAVRRSTTASRRSKNSSIVGADDRSRERERVR
jgi:uncharacterized protein YjiS (DUF1127 family)